MGSIGHIEIIIVEGFIISKVRWWSGLFLAFGSGEKCQNIKKW